MKNETAESQQTDLLERNRTHGCCCCRCCSIAIAVAAVVVVVFVVVAVAVAVVVVAIAMVIAVIALAAGLSLHHAHLSTCHIAILMVRPNNRIIAVVGYCCCYFCSLFPS